MTIQLVDGGWGKKFTEALSGDASELRIICPFIKVRALERLLRHNPGKVQVITRFNLADFAEESAMSPLCESCSIQSQGSAECSTFMRSCTSSGRVGHYHFVQSHGGCSYPKHEFGIVIEDKAIISRCLAYFDSLWHLAESDLLSKQVDSWTEPSQIIGYGVAVQMIPGAYSISVSIPV